MVNRSITRIQDADDVALPLQSGGLLLWNGTKATAGAGLTTDGTSLFLTGNLGIGTNSPQALLDVQGTDATLRLKGTAAWQYAGANLFDNNGVLSASFQWGNSASVIPNAFFMGTRVAGAPLIFLTGDGINERMRIDGSGKVGIGTNDPQSLLHVNGEIRSSALTVSGTVAANAINTSGPIAQSASSGLANYLRTNAANRASTTALNPGVLVFQDGGSSWGMDLGTTNAGAFATRVFGSNGVVLSVVNTSLPSQQSHFTDALVVNPDLSVKMTGALTAASVSADSFTGNLTLTSGKAVFGTKPDNTTTPLLYLDSNNDVRFGIGAASIITNAPFRINTFGSATRLSIETPTGSMALVMDTTYGWFSFRGAGDGILTAIDASGNLSASGHVRSTAFKNTLLVVAGGSPGFSIQQGFTTIPCYGDAQLYDPGNNYSASTGIYTVPITGLYQIDANIRLADYAPATSYGHGVHTSNQDGPWFAWYQTNTTGGGQRNGAIYRRVAFFNQGDQLRHYGYCDQTVSIGDRSMTIVLIQAA